MAELNTETARNAARTALGYSQAFDGKSIDWQSDQPWPHRIELAQALDWITELGAMVLNLADRAEVPAFGPGRDECVRAARTIALAYGCHDDAPGYLPRTDEAAAEFEPHAWVVLAMMQAYADGRADGAGDMAECDRRARMATELHTAACQAVALLNRAPEVARCAEGREARDILRQVLVQYAEDYMTQPVQAPEREAIATKHRNARHGA